MLVILLGPSCSGKDTIASHLANRHSFTRVHLTSQLNKSTPTTSPDSSPSKGEPSLKAAAEASSLTFDTPTAFLDYATLHWRQHFVTAVRLSRKHLEAFRKRPWVLLVNVEAPLTWRFARLSARMQASGSPPIGLEDFVKQDDVVLHGASTCSSSKTKADSHESPQLQLPSGPLPLPHTSPTPPTTPQLSRVLAKGLNLSDEEASDEYMPLVDAVPLVHLSIRPAAFATIEDLHVHLDKLDLVSEHRVRPSWDNYFMTLAELASLRSNCMKRRVGAVLISSVRKVVLSTGYNGTPRGMVNCTEGGCSRCNSTSTLSKQMSAPVRSGMDMEECLCLHAEENALLEAGRERAGAGSGGTLYCNTCPCLRCTVKIVQCGVSEVVYSQSYSMDKSSAEVFKQAGVQLRQIALKRDWTE